MALPYFYIQPSEPSWAASSENQSYFKLGMVITLDETNSKHAVQVLRMKPADQLHLTDGNGHLITATIINNHKKHCEVRVDLVERKEKTTPDVTIAIGLTKNANRFEWFLEKAAELGVHKVIPIITKRTENQKFKEERFQSILISAMLQSQQNRLLNLSAPIKLEAFIANSQNKSVANKYIAHCMEGNKQSLKYLPQSALVLIGPEGDFTTEEIEMAITNGYHPVTLGDTRLRTETAGIVAATLLSISN